MPSRICLVLMFAFGLVACGGSDASERQQALDRANTAMKALNEADRAFPDQYQQVTIELSTSVVAAPAKARNVLETKVLPLFDRYLATIDRAIATSRQYFTISPQPDLERDIAKIEARATKTHHVRDQLAAIATGLRDGSIRPDEVASKIGQVGFESLLPDK